MVGDIKRGHCKHFNIGDHGQRYEVRALDHDGKQFVIGWTDNKDGSGLVQMVEKHPVWHNPVVVDRGEKTMSEGDKKRGLYFKWDVLRINDPERKHDRCFKFVLDLNHDKFSVPALVAYVKACKKEYPRLANDLKDLLKAKKGIYKAFPEVAKKMFGTTAKKKLRR